MSCACSDELSPSACSVLSVRPEVLLCRGYRLLVEPVQLEGSDYINLFHPQPYPHCPCHRTYFSLALGLHDSSRLPGAWVPAIALARNLASGFRVGVLKGDAQMDEPLKPILGMLLGVSPAARDLIRSLYSTVASAEYFCSMLSPLGKP